MGATRTETVQLKRQPAKPRTAHTISITAANKPETIGPAAYGSLCRCSLSNADFVFLSCRDYHLKWFEECNLERFVYPFSLALVSHCLSLK
jgi:hypothetical protein